MINHEKSVKIAAVGASCTGKSSSHTHLEKKYGSDPRIKFVPEAATLYYKKNSHIVGAERYTVANQRKILDLQIVLEQEAEQAGPLVIFSDRAVVDAPAYVYSGGDLAGADLLYEHVKEIIPSYTHILLFDPTGVPYETTAIRTEDEATRWKIHQAFISFFVAKEIPYILVAGTLEDRIAFVESLFPF